MESSGGKKEPKQFVDYKFPPKRTAREWRDITRAKLKVYERIGFQIMGKKSRMAE